MRYNEILAGRIEEKLMHLADVSEKEIFGGLVFMVVNKMCIGVMKDKIMLRINPEILDSLADMDGWEQMTMGGK